VLVKKPFKKGFGFSSSPYYKAAAGGATTTWNPADKSAALVLSNGNLTATNPAAFAIQALRAVASHVTSGKFYHETHIDVAGSLNFFAQGIGNSSASFAALVGSDANAIGYSPGGGTVSVNTTVLATIQTSAQGDTLCFAVDLGNSKIWIRTNGGNWNNDILANQNPATNTGGVPFTGLAAGPYFPMGSMASTNDALTSNFGATAYAQSVPAGFGNW
jgi:hypothetical protein